MKARKAKWEGWGHSCSLQSKTRHLPVGCHRMGRESNAIKVKPAEKLTDPKGRGRAPPVQVRKLSPNEGPTSRIRHHSILHELASQKFGLQERTTAPSNSSGSGNVHQSPPSAMSYLWGFLPKFDPPHTLGKPSFPLTPVSPVGVPNCPNPYSFPPHLKGTGPLCAESKLPTFPNPRPSSQLTPNQGGGRNWDIRKN